MIGINDYYLAAILPVFLLAIEPPESKTFLSLSLSWCSCWTPQSSIFEWRRKDMYNFMSASCWINNWPGSENVHAKVPANNLGPLWELLPSFCDAKLRNNHPEGDFILKGTHSPLLNQSNDSSRILPYVLPSYVELLPFFNSLNLIFSNCHSLLPGRKCLVFSALIVVVLIF